MTEQYRKIAEEEINAAAERNPQEALLMVMANAALSDAEQKASGEKPHEPEFHGSGWSVAIETPNGVVGLRSCWLRDQFYLGYPKRTAFLVDALSEKTVLDIANWYRERNPGWFLGTQEEGFSQEEARRLLTGLKELQLMDMIPGNAVQVPPFRDGALISAQLIMDTLGVEVAWPVLQVNAVAVDDGYVGPYKDPDKPLVKNPTGRATAYREEGHRLWAKFYGPRVTGQKGRVWVDCSDWNSNSYHFDVVADCTEGLKTAYYGHSNSRGIFTLPFSFCNDYALDGPTAEPEAVQPYRDKFLALACAIAKQMGGAKAVNIDYGLVLVPEQLEAVGYSNIEWLKGQPGSRQGWGNEVVRAEKMTDAGKEVIILKSANSIVPWRNIRRVPCAAGLTTERLIELLTF